MRDKDLINDLGMLLLKSGYRQEGLEIIKLGYINQARIMIDPEHNILTLVGEIKDKEKDKEYLISYGTVNLEPEQLSGRSFYVIHSDLKTEYIGLGYGKDLYYAAIEWANNNGVSIISIGRNKTSDSVKMSKNLMRDPAIKTEQVVVINEEYLYSLSEIQMMELKDIIKKNRAYVLSDVDIEGTTWRRPFRGHMAIKLTNAEKKEIEGFDILQDFCFSKLGFKDVVQQIAIGYIFKPRAAKLPISIPVIFNYNIENKNKGMGMGPETSREEIIKLRYLESIRDMQVKLLRKDNLSKEEKDLYQVLIDPSIDHEEKIKQINDFIWLRWRSKI